MKSLFGILLLFGVLSVPGPAYSDKCKNPIIVIQNSTSYTVTIKNIKYYDGCRGKYRTEELANRDLSPGDSFTWTDDLEYVNDCKIPSFVVKFNGRCDRTYGPYHWIGTQWSESITPLEGANVKCREEVKYTIILTDANC